MIPRALIASLFLLIPLMGGCRSTSTDSPAVVSPHTAPEPAPNFTLKDMKGKSVSLADFKGQVVFLDFWATWCPPCRASLPEVERLFSDYQGKNLQVLGMNLDEDAADVVSFVAKKKVLYPVLLAGASDVSDRYGVGGIPHFVLIDREGRRVDQWSGFAPGVAREWRKAIDALLAAPAPKPSSTPNASPS